MSRTCSTKNGSLESLKVSVRCGFRAKARQMRQTAVWLSPVALARERVLQCVAPAGVASRGVASRGGGFQGGGDRPLDLLVGDRKSTRLNSSHANISYAVFCLKKKKTS